MVACGDTSYGSSPATVLAAHARQISACGQSNDQNNDGTLTPIPGETDCGGGTGPGAGNGGGGGSGSLGGSDPGGGSGGSTGPIIPPLAAYLLATLPPANGAVCGSPVASLPLGSNLPLGSTGKSTDVVQEWYLYEPSTLNPNPTANPTATLQSGQTIVGFIYETAGNPTASQPGQYFVQSTGADPNFVTSLVSTLPVLGNLLNGINNSTTGAFSQPLTAAQANAILAKYPPKGKGLGSGPCFSAPLPSSQWT
jgi:hypothetical protein